MERRIISVSELNGVVKLLLDNEPLLRNLAVRGELSNYKIYPSGHHYFTLKDPEGALRCVLFKGQALRLRFRPENGMKVVVTGRVSVFPRDGAYQLYAEEMIPEGAGDLAVAFDGDADRCLAVDEKGNVVNGDQMIAIFARQMKAENHLPGNTAVVTVMSSFGFFRFAREQGIHAETTKVGDRYVLENMRKNGYNIGGEQSGHIIFREFMPTGDGELSAIQLMRVMKLTGEPLSVLAGRMPVTPQVLLNVAADRDMKEALHESPEMEALIEECEQRLGDTGRILIRASGTEPLIRVMVEGENADLIRELAERLAAGCEQLLK